MSKRCHNVTSTSVRHRFNVTRHACWDHFTNVSTLSLYLQRLTICFFQRKTDPSPLPHSPSPSIAMIQIMLRQINLKITVNVIIVRTNLVPILLILKTSLIKSLHYDELLLFCCVTSIVNSYGHVGTVS